MSNIKSDVGVASGIASGLTKSSNIGGASVSFGATKTTPTSEMQQASSLASSSIEQVSSSLNTVAQGFNQVAQSFSNADSKMASKAG